MLNIMGTSLEPCGTPAKISFHKLKLTLILFLCKRLHKEFLIKRIFGETMSFKSCY